MTPRQKLPPYGRSVLEARNAALALGDTLKLVRVFYGTDCWQQAKDAAPALCVPAQDYEPGKYDWEPVAGLPVDIMWLDGDKAPELVAEIAAVAAPVTVLAGTRQWNAAEFLFTSASPQRLWTIEAEADYERRVNLYQRCLAADLGVLELSDDDRRQISGR